jgi:hypothetical protein
LKRTGDERWLLWAIEWLGSPAPIVRSDAAAHDDRSNGAERKYPALVIGDDNLFPGNGVSPFLMAPGLPDQFEAVAPQNRGNLAGVETGRSPVTQP